MDFKPYDIILSQTKKRIYCFLDSSLDEKDSFILLDSSGEEVTFSPVAFSRMDCIKVGECDSEENYTALLLLDDDFWNTTTEQLTMKFINDITGSDIELDFKLYDLIYDYLWLYKKELLDDLFNVLSFLLEKPTDKVMGRYFTEMFERVFFFKNLLGEINGN